MHPALETSIYAGLIPAAICGGATAGGFALARGRSDTVARMLTAPAAAAGLAGGLAAAAARLGLAPWMPEDALDWFLWAPPAVALGIASILLAGRAALRWTLALSAFSLASWLTTPAWESLRGTRWGWMVVTVVCSFCVWLATTASASDGRWAAAAWLAAAAAVEALILALTAGLRLADFATVGAAAMTAIAVLVLLLGGRLARQATEAAVSALAAGVGLLLAACATYGYLVTSPEYWAGIFFLPLLLPLASLVSWRSHGATPPNQIST